MVEYLDLQPDEWVRPRHRGYLLRCCDCGLVHRMDFRVVTHRGRPAVEFRMRERIEPPSTPEIDALAKGEAKS